MKQVQQILELILALAGCFFRKKRSKAARPQDPPVPHPPFDGDEADRGNTCPVRIDPDPGEATATRAANLLGWCLIVTAATAWYYNHLY